VRVHVKVYIHVEEQLAAAIGAVFLFAERSGSMVIDIGGGTRDRYHSLNWYRYIRIDSCSVGTVLMKGHLRPMFVVNGSLMLLDASRATYLNGNRYGLPYSC